MPRIAEGRLPAEPTSADQKDRYQRMLMSAARLGAQHDYERVQMHDVAKNAGVAIATLYRYFPSKAHLFTAVMLWEVERFRTVNPVRSVDDPAVAIAELLVRMSREMARSPRLSLAMIQANNQNQAQTSATGESAVNDIRFQRLLLETADITEPSAEDDRRLRLVVHCWYGVLTSLLNGRLDMEEAEADIRASCRLLVGDGANVAGLRRPQPSR